MQNRIHNFSAGPAVLPESVLLKAQKELLNFKNSGMSIMEMSHRSKLFESVVDDAVAGIRRELNVPEDYAVLFLQGGATLQFSMVPMNLYVQGQPVDFIQTGNWTQKAYKELLKIGEARLVANSEDTQFDRIPDMTKVQFNPNASYVYMCSNNTIYGTQFKAFPETGNVPLVADMSSDIFSRPLDISKFGLIFAGAQKNIGPSGVTLVIMRKELAARALENKKLASMLVYQNHIENNSLYNTCPTFGIYMIGLVMDWIKESGGVAQIQKQVEAKAKKLYDFIDNSDFYYGPAQVDSRSLMNIVYRIKDQNEVLEKEFVAGAEKAGLSGLKGHRLIGGLRASLYNAQTMDGVDALIQFMKAFEQQHS